MVRFLHLADLHLGAAPSYLRDLAEDRAKDYLDAFQRVVDFAIDPSNGIKAVLVVGDFFDVANPPENVIRFATTQLKRLAHAKVLVIVAPGNHDGIGAPGSIYRNSSIIELMKVIRSPQVEPFETLEIEGEVINFYGMAWDAQSKPPFDTFQKNNEAGYHIALIHGTLQGSLFTEGHSREVPLELENLAKSNMDYIALGHIHKFQYKKIDKTLVVYPGTLESRRLSPGEEGERYMVVVTLEKKKVPKIEQIKWNSKTTRIGTLDLNHETVETEEELANLIKTRYSSHNTLLRLKLVGSPSFVVNADELVTRLSGDFYWFDIDDNTSAFDSVLVETWEREDTIRGLYVRKLKQKFDNASSEEENQQLELTLKLAVQAFQKTSRV